MVRVAERRLSLAQSFKAGITPQPQCLRRVSDGRKIQSSLTRRTEKYFLLIPGLKGPG
jgi:hypothetical protein